MLMIRTYKAVRRKPFFEGTESMEIAQCGTGGDNFAYLLVYGLRPGAR